MTHRFIQLLHYYSLPRRSTKVRAKLNRRDNLKGKWRPYIINLNLNQSPPITRLMMMIRNVAECEWMLWRITTNSWSTCDWLAVRAARQTETEGEYRNGEINYLLILNDMLIYFLLATYACEITHRVTHRRNRKVKEQLFPDLGDS